ncbi:MAG: hypothetical protein WD114_07010 [Phycisphaerales bacterium]
MMIVAACAAGIAASPAIGGIGLQDFIVANATGEIFEVDGNSLATTQISMIQQRTFGFNEMVFGGGNMVYANLNGILIEHDLMTQQETVIFDVRDHIPQPSINYTMGLAQLSNDDLFFTINTQTPTDSPRQFAATLNLDTNEYTAGPDVELATGLYFDHHQLSDGTVLSADYGGERILRQDITTGMTLESFNVGYGVVSLFQQGNSIFSIAKEGEMFRFDIADGSSEYLGTISGAGNSLIAATVPAPSTLTFIALGGLTTIRRRR